MDDFTEELYFNARGAILRFPDKCSLRLPAGNFYQRYRLLKMYQLQSQLCNAGRVQSPFVQHLARLGVWCITDPHDAISLRKASYAREHYVVGDFPDWTFLPICMQQVPFSKPRYALLESPSIQCLGWLCDALLTHMTLLHCKRCSDASREHVVEGIADTSY